jgi:S-adenosylmethionine decarboxylase
MQGLHLTGDLSGCRCAAELLTNAATLEALCIKAVNEAGLTQVQRLFHSFAPGSGVTGVVLLAESHLAIHTWPELSSVTLDIYVCNYGSDNSAKAQALFDALAEAFDPTHCVRHDLQRGMRDADSEADAT